MKRTIYLVLVSCLLINLTVFSQEEKPCKKVKKAIESVEENNSNDVLESRLKELVKIIGEGKKSLELEEFCHIHQLSMKDGKLAIEVILESESEVNCFVKIAKIFDCTDFLMFENRISLNVPPVYLKKLIKYEGIRFVTVPKQAFQIENNVVAPK